jgi:hypothetical protein
MDAAGEGNSIGQPSRQASRSSDMSKDTNVLLTEFGYFAMILAQ